MEPVEIFFHDLTIEAQKKLVGAGLEFTEEPILHFDSFLGLFFNGPANPNDDLPF